MSDFVTDPIKISAMPSTATTPKKEPQARRIATNARILDAALEVFSELGFENTQLDQVAARAGCSRGAIYAQYASKEEVFLALMEHRVHTKFFSLYRQIQEESDLRNRREILRSWIVSQVCNPSWGTLTLEFKLYAVRRPESRERLLKLYEKLFSGPAKEFPELLFGKGLPKATRNAVERRFAVLGGALSGMVLESHFRPSHLPPSHLKRMVGELFDALVHT
jgi:AcrR family transcriptional regulator